MKYPLATVSIVLTLVLLTSYVAAVDYTDGPGKPRYANNFFSDFQTPTVAPGQRVDFSFNLTNPYDSDSAVMKNVTLVVGIYMYATQ
ncbi:MAG: hypothetical protein MUO18_07220 [Methanomassiliicoccales archaeon]|nr:hypothetical protein [Methanomassiliicoccales archaeon]